MSDPRPTYTIVSPYAMMAPSAPEAPVSLSTLRERLNRRIADRTQPVSLATMRDRLGHIDVSAPTTPAIVDAIVLDGAASMAILRDRLAEMRARGGINVPAGSMELDPIEPYAAEYAPISTRTRSAARL